MENIDLLKEEVHRANSWFYQAFEKLDLTAMERVWAIEEPIQCIHPGWDVLQGWDDIRDSWVAIFQNTEYIEFSVSDIHIEIEGEVAWVTCQENITQAIDHKTLQNKTISTNVFVKRGPYWKMVHHHGAAVFQPPDANRESET